MAQAATPPSKPQEAGPSSSGGSQLYSKWPVSSMLVQNRPRAPQAACRCPVTTALKEPAITLRKTGP
jgi:hypothetical protein